MEGECHFLEGNLRAKKQVKYAKRLLAEAGIEPERLRMYNMGASDAILFKAAADEMTQVARELGPNRVGKKTVAN
jgi:coenzyme F420-reducing hydrogenase delta subunit